MHTVVVGIDPGISGGIAFLDTENVRNPEIFKMPISQQGTKKEVDPAGIYKLIEEYIPKGSSDMVFCIEEVHSMSGQGTRSMFSFGCSFGMVVAVAASYKCPFHRVAPRRWKGVMLDGYTSKVSKDVSRLAAGRLFPAIQEKLVHKNSDGLAEALLLAEYARRLL